MAGARYRKNGKWAKAGTPGATLWGAQVGNKFVKVENIETININALRMKNRKPRAVARADGKFIPKAAYEVLINTPDFKEVERKRIEKIEKAAGEYKNIATAAFYDLAREFKQSAIDDFGFSSLKIIRRDPRTREIYETQETTSKANALYELNRIGYEGSEIATKANEEDGDTPPGVFNIAIDMAAPGQYLIRVDF